MQTKLKKSDKNYRNRIRMRTILYERKNRGLHTNTVSTENFPVNQNNGANDEKRL